MKIRVLVLTRYGELGASSRMRFIQYFPAFDADGFRVYWEPLFDDKNLDIRYRNGRFGYCSTFISYLRRIRTLYSSNNFHVIWIEKEALPWMPYWIEAVLLRRVPYVLDYDDALFHNYDRHSSFIIRLLFGRRLDKLMFRAAMVICGNKYISHRAELAQAKNIRRIPTVVDLSRYPLDLISHRTCVSSDAVLPRIVWIGSPSTGKCLEVIKEPMKRLSERIDFVFRIIGAEVTMPGVKTECLPWRHSSEVKDIAECDIGVMPLNDTEWERGKCGYKLIQYMACALPVVASDVGINSEIVRNNLNGYLATTIEDWINALHKLLISRSLRLALGARGRKMVEDHYCLQKTQSTMVSLISEVVRDR
jgi:glycosyltransferase involved in cell wall biosynthesis